MKLPKRVRNHVNPLADQTVYSFEGFPNNNPIIVDIGAYRGEFSQKLIEHFTERRNYIVAEIRKPYAHYLRELFSDNKQVAVFDGNSAKNLHAILAPSIKKDIPIEYIFINFPDPWFKEKHKKRRIITESFLQDCKTWIQPETIFVFQTDQQQLFLETQEALRDENITYKEFGEPLFDITSYWEEMKRGEGSHIYRMTFSIT